MFDNLICQYPLPGTPPAFIKAGHAFQTKDLDCSMSTYTIGEDGMFSEADHTGRIEFYTNNIVGSGPGLYTAQGEDAESVTYVAEIVRGKLTDLTETEHKVVPALPISAMQFYARPTSAQKPQLYARQGNFAGKVFYVLYGGSESGYWVRVVYKGARDICVVVEVDSDYRQAGDLELHSPSEYGNTFWDSEEAAMADKKARSDAWEAQKREYDDYVKSRGE